MPDTRGKAEPRAGARAGRILYRSGPFLILALMVGSLFYWLSGGFFQVPPGQVGIKWVLGTVVGTSEAGQDFNIPVPFGKVTLLPEKLQFATPIGDSVARTSDEPANDTGTPEVESLYFTRDENMAVVGAVVFWRIADTTAYFQGLEDPENTVSSLTEAALRQAIASVDFLDLMYRERGRIPDKVQPAVQSTLIGLNAGIEILAVQLQNIDYPPDAQKSMQNVANARQEFERGLNELNQKKFEHLEQTKNKARQIVETAQKNADERLQKAKRDVHVMSSLYAEYQASSDVVERAGYLAAIREIMETR